MPQSGCDQAAPAAPAPSLLTRSGVRAEGRVQDMVRGTASLCRPRRATEIFATHHSLLGPASTLQQQHPKCQAQQKLASLASKYQPAPSLWQGCPCYSPYCGVFHPATYFLFLCAVCILFAVLCCVQHKAHLLFKKAASFTPVCSIQSCYGVVSLCIIVRQNPFPSSGLHTKLVRLRCR